MILKGNVYEKTLNVTGYMSSLTALMQSEKRGGIFPVTYKQGMHAYSCVVFGEEYNYKQKCRKLWD